jgi:hypothetical protein
MGTMRTPETQQKYHDLIAAGGLKEGCALCGAPALKTFTYWKIVENTFPYDKVAKVHHMILPLRHASESEITPEEWEEYREIKSGYVQTEYEFIVEPTKKMKSIPAHFHMHMIIAKD